jgi:hypothetical protein
MDSIISPQTAIRLAKLTSFPAAFVLSGYMLSFSHNTVPALYDHKPQVTAKVFTAFHKNAGAIFPGLTFLSASASAYLAYALPEERREWATAATAMFATIPWALYSMTRQPTRMEAIATDERVTAKSEMTLEHRQLMIRWVKANWINVALQMFSGVSGLLAVVKA